MRDQRVRISFFDLPARPHGLSDAELDRVFGGGGAGVCTENFQCARGICYICPGSSPRFGYCRSGLC
jgi:hypothetical protein